MPTIFQTDTALDQLKTTAIARTKELMAQSDNLRDRREKANRKRIARLFKDPKAIEATIVLTDEVMRISSVKSSSLIFRRAAKKASIVGFGPINGLGLHFIGALSRLLPRWSSADSVISRIRVPQGELPSKSQLLDRRRMM